MIIYTPAPYGWVATYDKYGGKEGGINLDVAMWATSEEGTFGMVSEPGKHGLTRADKIPTFITYRVVDIEAVLMGIEASIDMK